MSRSALISSNDTENNQQLGGEVNSDLLSLQPNNNTDIYKSFSKYYNKLIGAIEAYEKPYYLLFLLTPLITETFSAAYKLVNFNTSIQEWTSYPSSMNIVAIIAIITFVLINSAVFYYYTTQPQKDRYTIKKEHQNSSDSDHAGEEEKSTAFKVGAGIGYLIIAANIGFYAWTSGKNAYNLINQIPGGKWLGFKPGAAYLFGVLCGVGAVMATVTYALHKVPKAIGTLTEAIHDRNVSRPKFDQVIKLIFLLMLAAITYFLFNTLSLTADMSPGWAAFSAISSTLVMFIIQVSHVFDKETEEEPDLNTVKGKIEQQKKDIKVIYQNKKDMPIIFTLAASFFLVNCLIAGAGIGFGIHYIESQHANILPKFLRFHGSGIWIFSLVSGVIAAFGRAYFCNHEQCIGRMMKSMNNLIKPSVEPQEQQSYQLNNA